MTKPKDENEDLAEALQPETPPQNGNGAKKEPEQQQEPSDSGSISKALNFDPASIKNIDTRIDERFKSIFKLVISFLLGAIGFQVIVNMSAIAGLTAYGIAAKETFDKFQTDQKTEVSGLENRIEGLKTEKMKLAFENMNLKSKNVDLEKFKKCVSASRSMKGVKSCR